MSGNAREVLRRMDRMIAIVFEEEMAKLQLLEENGEVTFGDVSRSVVQIQRAMNRRFVWGVESGVEPLGESQLGASDPHPPDGQR